jgi:hypothetical protein
MPFFLLASLFLASLIIYFSIIGEIIAQTSISLAYIDARLAAARAIGSPADEAQWTIALCKCVTEPLFIYFEMRGEKMDCMNLSVCICLCLCFCLYLSVCNVYIYISLYLSLSPSGNTYIGMPGSMRRFLAQSESHHERLRVLLAGLNGGPSVRDFSSSILITTSEVLVMYSC